MHYFTLTLSFVSYILARIVVPDFLLKFEKSSISLDKQSEVLWGVLFLFCFQDDVYANVLKIRSWVFAFTLYKTLLKNKKGFATSVLLNSLHDFSRKTFFTLCLINWLDFVTFWDIEQCVYWNYLFSSLWPHKFWNWLYQSVPLHKLNVGTKILIFGWLVSWLSGWLAGWVTHWQNYWETGWLYVLH